MGHGGITSLSYSYFFCIFKNHTKMIAKTNFKIEIRIKFMNIREYLLNISVGNASSKAIT